MLEVVRSACRDLRWVASQAGYPLTQHSIRGREPVWRSPSLEGCRLRCTIPGESGEHVGVRKQVHSARY